MSGVLGETREVFSKRLQNNPEQSLLARLSLVKWLRENGEKFGARAHNTQSAQNNPTYTGGIMQVTGMSAGGAVSDVTEFLANSPGLTVWSLP